MKTDEKSTRVFRTDKEQKVGARIAEIFSKSQDSVEFKIECFPRYVRRQHLKRFLAMYEIFKRLLPVKGSIVECGVYGGFGLMSWAKISTILEPENLTRRVYGFDSFEGLSPPTAHDQNGHKTVQRGDLFSPSYNELQELIKEYDDDRFLGHIPKIELIKGDITKTAKEFVTKNPHLIVSLLFLDCDLFEPTRAAIETFLPRMPKGAIVAFDELDNPIWPGETNALLETIGINALRLERIEWDPYIAFAVL